MAQITSKGKWWEIRNSLWILWVLLTFGTLNYIAFFYTSYKVKQRKWFKAGIIYSLLFIMMMVISEIVSTDHLLYDLVLIAYMIGWISSIIHVFKMRPEYLLRLEAKVSSGQKGKEIELLKQKIAEEYAPTNSIEDTEVISAANNESEPSKNVQKEKVKEPVSDVQIIEINSASEEDIAKIPGIGNLFAKKIVSVRTKEQGFKSFDHFVEVLSIKPHLIEKIKPYLIFPDTPSSEQMKKNEGRLIDF